MASRRPPGPFSLSWQDELAAQTSTAGLPLFDWVEENDRPDAPRTVQLTQALPP
jgi:hypothetical protein